MHCSIFKFVEMGNLKIFKCKVFFFSNSLSMHIRQKCLGTRCVFFTFYTLLTFGDCNFINRFFYWFGPLKTRYVTIVILFTALKIIIAIDFMKNYLACAKVADTICIGSFRENISCWKKWTEWHCKYFSNSLKNLKYRKNSFTSNVWLRTSTNTCNMKLHLMSTWNNQIGLSLMLNFFR